ncbi:MAG TPA: hypothetical protein VND93_09255 [Myxococcales bacterium]|nr:hypothetical protein [Myxococcales bacterium]
MRSDRVRLAVAATVVLAAAHLVAVALVLDQPDRIWEVHDAFNWIAAVFGAAGAVIAARTFERGDYLRRVWALLALGSGSLVVGHAIRSYWAHASSGLDMTETSLIYVRLAVIAVANTGTAWGLLLLAYSYARSGITVPRTAAFNVVWGLVSALALGLMVRQLREDVAGFDSGRMAASSLISIISTLGDTAGIILIAPVLRVAYLMRGGRLAGAWWAMGLSEALWLIYDCKTWIAGPLPFNPAHVMALLVVVRDPALSLQGLAGLLHRAAVTGPEV